MNLRKTAHLIQHAQYISLLTHLLEEFDSDKKTLDRENDLLQGLAMWSESIHL
jgi:hypothetical protein